MEITLYKKSGIFIPIEYKNRQFYQQIKKYLTRRVKGFNPNESKTYYFFLESEKGMLIPKYFPMRHFIHTSRFTIIDKTPEPEKIKINHNITPRNKVQERALDFLNNNKNGILQLPPGVGKCLAAGTEVLMYNGDIKCVEDVNIGDRLIGPDSKPRCVLGLGSGYDDLYKITPTKGRPYVVNKDHVLSLRINGNEKIDGHNPGSIVNISVEDYLKQTNNFKHHAKGWRSEAIEFQYRQQDNIKIPPYILGVWLGDGTHSHRRVCITNVDNEVIIEWKKFGEQYGLKCRMSDSNKTRCPSYFLSGIKGKSNPIIDEIENLKLWNCELFVPDMYKKGSIDIRLNILAGLLDTDGFHNKGYYEITTKHNRLANDITFIARSLGLYVKKSETFKKHQNWTEKRKYYRVNIYGECDKIPCKVERKKALKRRQKKNVLNVGIKVEYVGVGKYYGFELDMDGLFLLGDFTVTHNTVIMIHHASELSLKTFIMVHRDQLVAQWKERFLEFTDIKEDEIARLSTRTFEEDLKKPIIISTSQAFLAILKRRRNDFLKCLNSSKIGIFIGDEVHTSIGAPTFSECVLHIPCQYKYGVSATPKDRFDNNDDVIRFHLGDIYADEDSEGTMDAKVNIILLDYNIDVSYRRKYLYWSGKFQRSRYLNIMKNSDPFMNCVKSLINKLKDERNLLVIAERVDKMINILYDWVDHDNKCKFCGNAGIEELKGSLIYSTPGKMRDGVDVKFLDALILTSPISNITQMVGRVIRSKEGKKQPLIFDMVDIGCDNIKSTIFKRLDFYKSKNWKIQYIFYDKDNKPRIIDEENVMELLNQ